MNDKSGLALNSGPNGTISLALHMVEKSTMKGAQCGTEILGLERLCLDKDALDPDFRKGHVPKCQLISFDGVTRSPTGH